MRDNESERVLTDVQVTLIKSKLDEQQQEIIFRRIGHGYHRIQSLSYIAKDFKLSRERIRQIQNESLVRLNDPEITHLVLLAETQATYQRNETRRERVRATLNWRSALKPKSSIEEQREKHESAYEAWSPDEDHRLWDGHQSGLSSKELAKIHSRSVGAIQSRLKKIREGDVKLDSSISSENVAIDPTTPLKMTELPAKKTREALSEKSLDPHPSEYGNLTIKPTGQPEAILPGNELCPSCGMIVTGNRMTCRCS